MPSISKKTHFLSLLLLLTVPILSNNPKSHHPHTVVLLLPFPPCAPTPNPYPSSSPEGDSPLKLETTPFTDLGLASPLCSECTTPPGTRTGTGRRTGTGLRSTIITASLSLGLAVVSRPRRDRERNRPSPAMPSPRSGDSGDGGSGAGMRLCSAGMVSSAGEVEEAVGGEEGFGGGGGGGGGARDSNGEMPSSLSRGLGMRRVFRGGSSRLVCSAGGGRRPRGGGGLWASLLNVAAEEVSESQLDLSSGGGDTVTRGLGGRPTLAVAAARGVPPRRLLLLRMGTVGGGGKYGAAGGAAGHGFCAPATPARP